MFVKADGKNVSRYGFHSFRKFFASMIVNNNVPPEMAKKLLRHKKLELTLNVYAKYGTKVITETMETIDPFKSGQSNAGMTTSPASTQNSFEGLFASKSLELFNDWRSGKIEEEEYQAQKQELMHLQSMLQGKAQKSKDPTLPRYFG